MSPYNLVDSKHKVYTIKILIFTNLEQSYQLLRIIEFTRKT